MHVNFNLRPLFLDILRSNIRKDKKNLFFLIYDLKINEFLLKPNANSFFVLVLSKGERVFTTYAQIKYLQKIHRHLKSIEKT